MVATATSFQYVMTAGSWPGAKEGDAVAVPPRLVTMSAAATTMGARRLRERAAWWNKCE
jgi:hypothetical protein